MKNCIKRRAAIVLAVATLLGSPGLTALGGVIQDPYEPIETDDYHLVTLMAGEGTFEYPLKWRGKTASSSDASPSNAHLEKSKDRTKTTFVVVDDDVLWKEDVEEAAENAGLQWSGRTQASSSNAWKASSSNAWRAVWLEKDGDLTTEINDELSLKTKNKTLYAYWTREAESSADGIEDIFYKDPSLILAVNNLSEDQRLSDKESIDQVFEEAKIKSKYSKIDYDNGIQLDIEAIEANEKTPVEITLKITDAFFVEQVEAGRKIVALHKGKSRWEAPDVTLKKGEDSVFVTFKLRDFSPVVLFLADERAEKTVKVTLKKSKDGTAAVYKREWIDEEDKEVRTYIPVEETVSVPYDSDSPYENRLYIQETWRRYDAPQKGLVCVNIVEKYADGKEEEKKVDAYGSYELPDEVMSVTITPVFGDTYDFAINPSSLDKKSKLTAKVQLYYNNQEAEASEWQLWNKDWTDVRGNDQTYDPNWHKNDLFELKKDGTLTSKKELEEGNYTILIGCKYNGKTLVSEGWINVGQDIDSDGIHVVFSVGIGVPQNPKKENDLYYGSMFGERIEAGKKFGDLTNIPEVKMFGNYEPARWFNYKTGKEMQTGDVINSRLEVVAMFKKKDSNGWYIPPKGVSQGNGQQSNTTTTTRRPSTGNSASSGSTAATGTKKNYTLTGTWKRDSRGWKFQPNSGSAPRNTWGSINGSWYYFGSDGYMKTGWVQVDNKWYYMNPASGSDEGKMMTGWVYDNQLGKWFYLDSTGMMKTGWQQIGDKWYYLNLSSDGTMGAMAANTWIGGYYVDANGVWIKDAVR